ncbi:hypothetical protein R1flu_010664 [Riccia fluitans]|uniref:Uncharacterized protein n=1 Tax=Riccia fluitans TaxID=41844 RepID=A0ABD1Z5M6_9MARC
MASRKHSRDRSGGNSHPGPRKLSKGTAGSGTTDGAVDAYGGASPPSPPVAVPQERVDGTNIHSAVTTEECLDALKITDENRDRIVDQGKIFWPTDCADPELGKQAWKPRFAMYGKAGVIAETAPAMIVTPVFVKLLIAEFKKGRQVSYAPVQPSGKQPSTGLRDVDWNIEPDSKRPAIAGDPPPPVPNLLLKGVGRDLFPITPSILRKPGGAGLDYLGSDFRLTDGIRPPDLTADFQKVQQMINSLNPLLPPTSAAAAQNPIFKFQGAMNQALDLLKTKCKSMAAANEAMMSVRTGGAVPSPHQEMLSPKLEQVQTNLLEAVHKLQTVVESKRDGSEAVGLIQEVQRLKQENERLKKSYVKERTRADEMTGAFQKERRKAEQYVKLARLNILEEAGFLKDNRYDPPAPTLEACDLVVMNKPNHYWAEFEQDRFTAGNHDQKVALMSGWDPTNPATKAPAWATTFDRQCPVCQTVIGPEGGYSVGTCRFCIYHVGCLQQFLMVGNKLECTECTVKFNIRLWQAFRLTNKMQELLPELAEDGRELVRRQPVPTDDEFEEWLQKDALFLHVHDQLFRRIMKHKTQVNDRQFRDFMNVSLPLYIDRKAESWGLTRPDWREDVKMNVRAIVYHQEEGVGVPPFPQAITDTGLTARPDWPQSFWRPTQGAGPA